MRKHRILKALAIGVSALGLLLVGTNVAPNSHVAPTTVAVHASSHNLYWQTVDFAAQRGQDYYPQITYNTRDLGGLRTSNGRYEIKPNMLYRSANLHYLTRQGANTINHLRIHTDIDLRAMYGPNSSISAKPQPGEFHKMGNRGIHLRYYNFPVENSQQEAYTWPIRKRLGETYRFHYWYTLNPVARQAYHNSIMLMIKLGRNPRRSGALMYNCTQGRDRTGTLSVITEYLLGMSKSTIYNDFLLTNYYKYQTPYTDQISRINKFYSTVYHNYGSMWRYVRYGLSLSRSDIKALKYEYLQRV